MKKLLLLGLSFILLCTCAFASIKPTSAAADYRLLFIREPYYGAITTSHVKSFYEKVGKYYFKCSYGIEYGLSKKKMTKEIFPYQQEIVTNGQDAYYIYFKEDIKNHLFHLYLMSYNLETQKKQRVYDLGKVGTYNLCDLIGCKNGKLFISTTNHNLTIYDTKSHTAQVIKFNQWVFNGDGNRFVYVKDDPDDPVSQKLQLAKITNGKIKKIATIGNSAACSVGFANNKIYYDEAKVSMSKNKATHKIMQCDRNGKHKKFIKSFKTSASELETSVLAYKSKYCIITLKGYAYRLYYNSKKLKKN